MSEEYIEIGYTQKAHGVKGEIKIFIEEEFIDELEHLEVLFLNVRGNVLPYFIEEKRGTGNYIIKFEDVNDKEAAERIKAAAILAKPSDLKYWEPFEEQELFYNHCIGYQMIDINDGDLGIIKEMLEYPQQELAIIEINGKEVLFPMNEQTVKGVDNDNKKVTVEMPEGLLTIHDDEEE